MRTDGYAYVEITILPHPLTVPLARAQTIGQNVVITSTPAPKGTVRDGNRVRNTRRNNIVSLVFRRAHFFSLRCTCARANGKLSLNIIVTRVAIAPTTDGRLHQTCHVNGPVDGAVCEYSRGDRSVNDDGTGTSARDCVARVLRRRRPRGHNTRCSSCTGQQNLFFAACAVSVHVFIYMHVSLYVCDVHHWEYKTDDDCNNSLQPPSVHNSRYTMTGRWGTVDTMGLIRTTGAADSIHAAAAVRSSVVGSHNAHVYIHIYLGRITRRLSLSIHTNTYAVGAVTPIQRTVFPCFAVQSYRMFFHDTLLRYNNRSFITFYCTHFLLIRAPPSIVDDRSS